MHINEFLQLIIFISYSMASINEVEVHPATDEEGQEEEEGDEQVLLFTVPYVHNGYILEYLSQHGNTATANMLFELPLCRLEDSRLLVSSVSRLKRRRDKLVTQTPKSAEQANEFEQFLSAEFVFPVPSDTPRL